MRIHSPMSAMILRKSSLGPAAMAARHTAFQQFNQGLPQRAYINRHLMARGGSMGHLGKIHDDGDYNSLGCCAGMRSGLGAVAVPNVVKIGPIAARMIALRKAGKGDQYALLDALTTLDNQGIKTVTPEIHLQLAAGMQPIKAGLSGFLGALGLAPVVNATIGAGATTGTVTSIVGGSAVAAGASAIGLTTVGTGIGTGILIGQTAIPIPVVGAAIGAIVWAASHFLARHVGKAEAQWTSPGFYASLRVTPGREYDQKQFSEAFKGMMDTGNNIIPGCGPDRHKNPDCLLGPMAGVIAQGYLSQTVPLTATTAQVFQQVVTPWLQSGAGGLVNWATLSREPTQLLMFQAATDRYLAGQAMTRGDMPEYSNQGSHTPTLVQALAPILQQPMTTTPQVNGVTAPISPTAQQQLQQAPLQPVPAPVTFSPSGAPIPTNLQTLPAYPSYVPPTGGGGPAVGYSPPPIASPLAPAVATAGGTSLPTWLGIGLAVVAAGFALARPASHE